MPVPQRIPPASDDPPLKNARAEHPLYDLTALTLDVDWAPDWCLELCCRRLVSHGVRATFYVTHQSPFIRELAADPRFEIGIHPNFLPHSTQGSTVEETLDHCLEIAPQATSIRTHSLFQSIPLLSLIMERYTQIRADLSLFLPFHPDLRPVPWRYHGGGEGIIRFPYYWQDDVVAGWPGWTWDGPPPLSGGLKIFDFHPVLLALNINDLQPYLNLKAHLGRRPLFEAQREDFSPFINSGLGDSDFLDRMISHFGAASFKTVSEMCEHIGG